MAAIPDPDLGYHGLHQSLALGKRADSQSPFDVLSQLRQFRRARDVRLTPQYLHGEIRATSVEQGQLGRQFFNPAGAYLFSQPSVFERLEVPIQRSLSLPDARLYGSKLALPSWPAPLHGFSPPLDRILEKRRWMLARERRRAARAAAEPR